MATLDPASRCLGGCLGEAGAVGPRGREHVAAAVEGQALDVTRACVTSVWVTFPVPTRV
jgi:hypothetical protein